MSTRITLDTTKDPRITDNVFVSMERRLLRENLTDAVQAHEPIAKALEARNASAAQEAMRVHIETSYAGFLGWAQGYTLLVGRTSHEVDSCTELASRQQRSFF
jgi:hypothetical protein